MTYVETGYAQEHNVPCAYVQNAAGNFVSPSAVSDARALTHDTINIATGEQDLSGVFNAPEADAYSISAYSYLVTQTSGLSADKGKALSQFVLFLACRPPATPRLEAGRGAGCRRRRRRRWRRSRERGPGLFFEKEERQEEEEGGAGEARAPPRARCPRRARGEAAGGLERWEGGELAIVVVVCGGGGSGKRERREQQEPDERDR